jgi:hypothetical protein
MGVETVGNGVRQARNHVAATLVVYSLLERGGANMTHVISLEEVSFADVGWLADIWPHLSESIVMLSPNID